MEQPVPQRITSVVKVTQAISWSEGLVMPAAVIAARAAVEKIIGPVRLMCESYTTRSAPSPPLFTIRHTPVDQVASVTVGQAAVTPCGLF